MSEPITITVPLWVCLAICVWLTGVLLILQSINTQIKILYNLYLMLRREAP